MKKVVLIVLIVVLFLSGQAFADMGKTEWKDAPPLTPWTVLFSAYASNTGIYGEIIIAQSEEDKPIKVSGKTIYLEKETVNENYFFEAIYIGDQKPTEFIEIINRGKGKYPAVIQNQGLKDIIQTIKESNENWIILHDY